MTLEQAHTKAGKLADNNLDVEFCVVWEDMENGYAVAWPEELDTFYMGCKIVATHHKSSP